MTHKKTSTKRKRIDLESKRINLEGKRINLNGKKISLRPKTRDSNYHSTNEGFIVNGKAMQIGDSWRVKEISTCVICGSKTDRRVLAGLPCPGPRAPCPAGNNVGHEQLERWLIELEHMNDLHHVLLKSKKQDPVIKQNLECVHDKILVLRDRITMMRSIVRKDDVVQTRGKKKR